MALGGSVSNIVLRPWGHVAMWTLLYAIGCLAVLRVWSGCLLRRHHVSGAGEEDEDGSSRGSLVRGDSMKVNATDLEQGGSVVDGNVGELQGDAPASLEVQKEPVSSKGSAVELVSQQSVRGAVAVAAV